MTAQEWMNQARENIDALIDLITDYHPGSFRSHAPVEITAPGAEMVSKIFRKRIAGQEAKQEKSPAERFRDAVTGGDVETTMRLLEQAWIGVPESTSCWSIRGFKEAVDLLDDPPEQPEPEPGVLQ